MSVRLIAMAKKKRQGRPPKPAAKQKKRYLQVRITDAEKAAFDRAAEIDGKQLAVWVRDRLRIAAQADLERKGESPGF
jgi:uncharacterized protein (DUF1778 family)